MGRLEGNLLFVGDADAPPLSSSVGRYSQSERFVELRRSGYRILCAHRAIPNPSGFYHIFRVIRFLDPKDERARTMRATIQIVSCDSGLSLARQQIPSPSSDRIIS
jgi:hypothetical protein